jgi:hypothetical protein
MHKRNSPYYGRAAQRKTYRVSRLARYRARLEPVIRSWTRMPSFQSPEKQVAKAVTHMLSLTPPHNTPKDGKIRNIGIARAYPHALYSRRAKGPSSSTAE